MGQQSRPRPAPRGSTLPPREVEVLALVGLGFSDGDIAERLFISKRTASVHVADLKVKLETAIRVETALAAVRMGLVVGAQASASGTHAPEPHDNRSLRRSDHHAREGRA